MVSVSSILGYEKNTYNSLTLTVPTANVVSKEPMINESNWTIPSYFKKTANPSHKILWKYFKETPEMVALFTTIVEDILSDGWHLIGGRNNKKQANDFLEENNAKQTIASFLYDSLVTGDGYIYKSAVTPSQAKKVVNNVVKSIYGKQNRYLSNNILTRIKTDYPDVFKVRSFKTVPSSTMAASFDIHGNPINYVQTVAGKQAVFTPNEIIHWRYMQLDGKFYGFTPMTSVLREIEILSSVKDYARYFFDKGGVPNFMFILKNETPDSPTHKAFKNALRLYSTLTNKYKSLVLTGEVDVKELNKLTKDMEYRELARYVTQVMVMTWGVPASRLSDVLVTQGMKTSVTSSEGYYRKISHYQDILEDIINTQLLKDYGVKLRFNRTYKQDEVREVQIEKMKTDIVQQRLSMGLVNEEWVFDYLKIPEEMRGEMVDTKEIKNNLNNQEMNKIQQLNQSEDKQFDNNMKQSAAIQNKL